MSTFHDVSQYIEKEIPRGAVFTAKDLLGVASRSNVDQLLSWFARTGKVRRVARGIYFRPFRYDHGREPTLLQVVRVRAEAKGERLQVHGADAAAALGLRTRRARAVDAAVSEGAPAARFYTSGRTRLLILGNVRVRFQHVPSVILSHPFTRAGEALAALHHAGPSAVATVRARLDDEDLERVRAAVPFLPDRTVAAWHAAGEPPRDPKRLRVVRRPAGDAPTVRGRAAAPSPGGRARGGAGTRDDRRG